MFPGRSRLHQVRGVEQLPHSSPMQWSPLALFSGLSYLRRTEEGRNVVMSAFSGMHHGGCFCVVGCCAPCSRSRVTPITSIVLLHFAPAGQSLLVSNTQGLFMPLAICCMVSMTRSVISGTSLTSSGAIFPSRALAPEERTGWKRTGNECERDTDKLLFSSWSEPPTQFAYRHRSLSSVRLGRVVSCRVVSRPCLGFIPSVRLTHRPLIDLSSITRRFLPFSLHNPFLPFLLFLILPSSPSLFSYYDISQCFCFNFRSF